MWCCLQEQLHFKKEATCGVFGLSGWKWGQTLFIIANTWCPFTVLISIWLLFKNDPFLCLLFRFLLEIIIVYLLFKKAFFLLSFEVTYTQKLIKAFVKPRWQGLSKTTTKSALLCISKESLFKVKLELSNCPISVCGHAALGPIVLSAVFVTAVLLKYSGFCFACRSLHYYIFESVFTSFRILFPASILKNVSSDYSW